MIDLTPFILSFKLAFITSVVLFVISLPIAYFLAFTKSKIKPFLEALFSMPIVLPPSVIGFYLLILLSPNSVIGSFFNQFDIKLVFSFTGLVIASVIYSFPFMLQPLQNGFEAFDKRLIEASYMCGKNEFTTFFKIILPNIKNYILTGFIISFAHTVGEFGVVLMVGGSIDGVTKVASVAIYDFVEVIDYKSANFYSLIMVGFSFIVLFIVQVLKQNGKNRYF